MIGQSYFTHGISLKDIKMHYKLPLLLAHARINSYKIFDVFEIMCLPLHTNYTA